MSDTVEMVETQDDCDCVEGISYDGKSTIFLCFLAVFITMVSFGMIAFGIWANHMLFVNLGFGFTAFGFLMFVNACFSFRDWLRED